jgi:hypothetical protein
MEKVTCVYFMLFSTKKDDCDECTGAEKEMKIVYERLLLPSCDGLKNIL